MPIVATVIPGYVFYEGEIVVRDSLNALGLPVLVLTGSVGGSEIAAGGVNDTHAKPGSYFHAIATGTGTAYSVTLAPAPSALAAGLWFSFRAPTANTGPLTVNVNGLGNKPLLLPNRQPLAGGEITAGQQVWVQYDGSQFQMISPRSIPHAWYAADSGAANAYVITLPGVEIVALNQLTGIPITFLAAAACTGASTLAVNGLAATAITKKGATALSANDIQTGHAVTVVYDGTRFQLVGSMDAPGLPSLGVAGTTVYPYSVTFDDNGRLTAISGGVNYTTVAVPAGGASVTFTHGLGRTPAFVRAVLLMGATTEHGFTVGDERDVSSAYMDSGTNDFDAFGVTASATSVVVSRYNDTLYIPHKTTGLNSAVTTANWQLKIYAW